MDIIMVGLDVLVLMVMVGMLKYSYAFSKLSLTNKDIHYKDMVAQMHFQDHAIAVMFSLIGSTIGSGFAAFHIFQQHILKVDTYWSEFGLGTGFIFLAASGLMFMRHMICEETPGHPYYVREYNIDEDSHVQLTEVRHAERYMRKKK